MQIKCEKCSAVPETYLEGEVELTFLRCPSCGEVYPVCATDSALRKDIAEYNRMRSLIRRKVILMFGWHIRVKGVDIALKAFEKVIQKEPKTTLFIHSFFLLGF